MAGALSEKFLVVGAPDLNAGLAPTASSTALCRALSTFRKWTLAPGFALTRAGPKPFTGLVVALTGLAFDPAGAAEAAMTAAQAAMAADTRRLVSTIGVRIVRTARAPSRVAARCARRTSGAPARAAAAR